MSPTQSPEPEVHALYRKALARLRVTLQIDTVTLKLLRQAAEAGLATELATYGWALRVVPDELTKAGPMVAAEAYDQALRQDDHDPAVAFGAGLANIGTFSRRRSVSPAARRGFTQAARLDADNLLPHLAMAAVRQSAGDDAAAHQALDRAATAARFSLYPSPVAGLLTAESPWLAQSWSILWADRTAAAVHFVVRHEARIAESLQRRSSDARPPLARLERLARRMVELTPDRAAELLLATSTVLRVLTVRAQVRQDAAARLAVDEVGELVAQLLAQRRELGHGFDAAVKAEMAAAGVGVASGLAGVVVGLARSGRRWPPPWPPALALPGRTIALASLVATGLSAGSVAVTNPVAATYRRVVERRLLARETQLVAAAAGRIRERLAALPAL